MVLAELSRPYGALALKNMSPKMDRVRHCSAKGDLPPDGRLFMTRNVKRFLYYWFPVLVYCLLIFLQSSCRFPKTVPDLPHIDKVFHFVAYAVLGVLFFRAYRSRLSRNIRFLMILSIFSAGLYGISDELHQYFVPYREADLMDIIADMLGSSAGAFGYLFWEIKGSGMGLKASIDKH